MTNPTPIRSAAPAGAPATGSHGGNGELTRHRLDEVERRMGVVERKVDELVTTCTRIETKLDEIASKSYVWRLFGGTAVVLLLSIVAHILIRTLTPG